MESSYSWPDLGQKRGLSVIPGTETLFAAGYLDWSGERGILKSTNAGATWDTILTAAVVTSLHTPDIRHGWAAAGGKIYRYDWEPPVNHAPFFVTELPDTSYSLVDNFYEQILEADDSDNDTLNFTALQLPNFLTLQEEDLLTIYSATIQGTPTLADTGYHNIEIEVTDGRGGADTISWVLYVDNVTSTDDYQTLFEFRLNQNYPNPFNPSTSLQYAISSRQFVTLKVYDLLGREVATLVSEEKPAGEYEVEFNAANLLPKGSLTSGIYFYQLKAGSFVETRKMVLLK